MRGGATTTTVGDLTVTCKSTWMYAVVSTRAKTGEVFLKRKCRTLASAEKCARSQRGWRERTEYINASDAVVSVVALDGGTYPAPVA